MESWPPGFRPSEPGERGWGAGLGGAWGEGRAGLGWALPREDHVGVDWGRPRSPPHRAGPGARAGLASAGP